MDLDLSDKWHEVQRQMVAPWGPLTAEDIARIDARTADKLDELAQRHRQAAGAMPGPAHTNSESSLPNSRTQESGMSASQQARSTERNLDGLKEAGEDMKQRIKDGAEELVENGEEALSNVGNKFRGQVRNRPMTSLVVAGGIGLLLGLLIARKR